MQPYISRNYSIPSFLVCFKISKQSVFVLAYLRANANQSQIDTLIDRLIDES